MTENASVVPPSRDWLLVARAYETDLQHIVRVTSAYFNIPTFMIRAKRRSQPIVRARMICMSFAKQMTTLSLTKIGAQMGGFDHSTVMHAIQKIGELRKTDPKIDEAITAIMAELSQQETRDA